IAKAAASGARCLIAEESNPCAGKPGAIQRHRGCPETLQKIRERNEHFPGAAGIRFRQKSRFAARIKRRGQTQLCPDRAPKAQARFRAVPDRKCGKGARASKGVWLAKRSNLRRV